MTAIIIPAFNPEKRIVQLVEELQKIRECAIIIVDDGSSSDYRDIFNVLGNDYHCEVCRHTENLGKGEALKTGIRFAVLQYPGLSGIVTADADGQHLPEDIFRIADALPANPDSLVLGVRDLGADNVPFKSRWGNRITSLVFRLSTKISCPDTQTGLRAIPANLFDFCLSVPGSRYEYEMNMLTAAAKNATPLVMIPIATVYLDNNSSSHFHPVSDSVRVYFNFIKFGLSSLLCAAADLTVFTLLTYFIFKRTSAGILAATVIARCLSGVLNFALNKLWCFGSRGNNVKQALKYFALFVTQMLLSWAFVTLLSYLPANLTILKMFVDGTLFVISYLIQSKLIFGDKSPAVNK